ncbi:flagellar export protein FliJ [Crassaminicella thermophila]|uniref:Flagellar FliJ protein n=1 Tax=Crassaminicella thermophila TaxID=2599308 RepID=A0A5C0SES7_CRATE|nr:flagellar export protein FliJ [Crassaminicella thermophila]
MEVFLLRRFRFRYQNLLEVKEKYEDIIKRKLNEAQIKFEEAKKQLDILEDNKKKYQESINLNVKKGVDIGYLRMHDLFLMNLKREIRKQIEVIEVCKDEVNKCRMELMKASKEKRIFEKLKEKERENFHYIEKKEEDSLIDQLVTFKNYKSN